jgi:N-glycosylase/DNA lyase
MRKRPDKITRQELKALHHEQQNAIRQRLKEFSQVPKAEYFYELLYCLLTPQSSAVNADTAVKVLRNSNIFYEDIDPEPFLHGEEYYIRFHKTKAKHISGMKKQFSLIVNRLSDGSSGVELREWLVKNVNGLGWKESSHFLRNIGYRNLAILDRHILRNLVRTGALRALPKTLTAKKYLSIEKKFRTFSDSIGISMDELDLLFWSMETGEILK